MKVWIALLFSLLLVACDKSPAPIVAMPSAGTHSGASAAGTNAFEPARLARGATLYQQNCATCHGARGEGAFNWQQQGADGKWLPPPLDASGHAWHHPQAALEQVIREGTQTRGGNMPSWGKTLSDADIRAVIVWFQSLWPDPIYTAWADIDRRARAGEK